MEAHSISTNIPRAKEGGLAAGISAVIREVGELLARSGGLVVVVIGVVAVITITSASLGTVPEAERATIAASAFTVLGTIVGAFFGLRAGSRGRDEAEAARDLATTKVAHLAAHIEADDAERVLKAVDEAAR